MDAGREMDAEIARRVMGICPHPLHAYKADNRDPHDDYTTYRCRKCKQTFRGLSYKEGAYVCPAYSTDIASAWEVVRFMQTKGYEMNLNVTPTLTECRFVPESVDYASQAAAELHVDVFGQNVAPLAICRAALKAVGS